MDENVKTATVLPSDVLKQIQETMAQLKADKPEGEPEVHILKDGKYVFVDDKDEIGLPVESALYVDRTCKGCLGRGYATHLIGDGYHPGNKPRKVNEERRLRTCGCVIKGYVKVRVKVERAADNQLRTMEETVWGDEKKLTAEEKAAKRVDICKSLSERWLLHAKPHKYSIA